MPKLSEDHVKSGFTTSLLKELLDHPNCKSTHLQYALMKLRITSPKPFNTSFLSASKLLKLGLRDNASFEKLCDCGMLIEGEDIKYAIRILPNSRADLFKILLAHCTTLSKVFQSACDMAKKVNKKQLLAVLQQDAMVRGGVGRGGRGGEGRGGWRVGGGEGRGGGGCLWNNTCRFTVYICGVSCVYGIYVTMYSISNLHVHTCTCTCTMYGASHGTLIYTMFV